ncbi:hypothetical protein PVAND_010803 [Polypedilum vanderplanki]|uniref:Uncharacterized protein n=1 Tax=Polypedilum vanderplanki TaxID=319348 RepID=A0A9J6CGP6_POLVA|nr:hypothetical protein PVAND_010803 [Polypedilum vanderplanki]
MNLSEYSTEVVGFDSTWNSNKQVHVRDIGTETEDSTQTQISNKNIGTTETKEIGVQAAPFVKSNSNEETDKKLAEWLRRIMPALERELSEGVTQVHESSSMKANSSFAQVTEYQKIDVKSNFQLNTENSIFAVGQWLSIVLQNNPALILSCSIKKTDANEASPSYIILYEPQRSKVDSKIYWHEVYKAPSKQYDFLVVNSENRDLFAAANSTGDFSIWSYIKSSNNESRLVEIFSKAEDSILALTFLNENTLLCCLSDGSIASYKILVQHCKLDKIMKIDQRRVKDSQITAITNISGTSDFIIGFFNGKIFYCSMNQFTSQEIEDPITRELNSHKFAVKLLKHCNHSGKSYIVSFDASSEIFIHEIDDDPNEKSLKYVIRLPLPIKNCISLTSNIEHIFCPLSNGGLEIFNSKNNSRRIIDGRMSGTNILCELSKNESWLLTGIFDGVFNIYNVFIDNNDY